MYVERLAPYAGDVIGLEYDFERAQEARRNTAHLPNSQIVCAAGERLPFAREIFSAMLSHEVLEHVEDDRAAVERWCAPCNQAAGWSSSSPTGAILSRPTEYTGAEDTGSEISRWSTTCHAACATDWRHMFGSILPETWSGFLPGSQYGSWYGRSFLGLMITSSAVFPDSVRLCGGCCRDWKRPLLKGLGYPTSGCLRKSNKLPD